MGKFFIIAGVILIVVGIILSLAPQLPFLGKLPGDFHVKGRNYSIYFPLATSILLSILLTIILNLFIRK